MESPDQEPSPWELFSQWYEEANECREITFAGAMCLSTVGSDGYPQGRMVILRGHDERGLAFFTHSRSEKARALEANPRGAVTFYWPPLGRQVRVQGDIAGLTREEVADFTATQRRDSLLLDWTSPQSREVDTRREVEDLVRSALKKWRDEFGDDDLPPPPDKVGYRLVPRRFIFWREEEDRIHTRICFTRDGGQWRRTWLCP